MKIRTGFVSNSSTSSFLIYGVCIDAYKTLEEDEGRYDIGEKLCEGTDLIFFCPYEEDDLYIGKSWSSIKDDETGLEFKNSVEEKIKSILPETKCGTHSEAWRD